MIKIIEPGTRTITECAECGCKFSYEKEDIEVIVLYSMDQLQTRKPYIVCPQCHKSIALTVTR